MAWLSLAVNLGVVLVLGHRANTPRWVKRFLSEGADGVEIDFYCSKGLLYASHVSILGRARLLRERIASLLTSIHILGPYRVDELVELLPPGSGLMLDLKSSLDAGCVERLTSISGAFDVFVSLRDYRLAAVLSDNGVRTLLSMDHRPLDVLSDLGETSAIGVSINKMYLDHELVEKLHARGYVVATWTINSVEEALQSASLGVDIIVTDYPGEVAKALGKGVRVERGRAGSQD